METFRFLSFGSSLVGTEELIVCSHISPQTKWKDEM